MPGEVFPKRSRESDFGAAVVQVALADAVAQGRISNNAHFMVSVVVLQNRRMIVAVSGSNRAAIVQALQDSLNIGTRETVALRTEQLSRSQFKKLDEKRKKKTASEQELETLQRQGIVTQRIAQFEALRARVQQQPLYRVPNEVSDLSHSLLDPDRVNVVARIQTMLKAVEVQSGDVSPSSLPSPLTFAPGRYCSEPKALQAAFKTGQPVVAMTTFWHGPTNAPEFTPYIDPEGPDAGLPLALPCQFCRLNQHRIMQHLKGSYGPSTDAGAQGRRPRSYSF